MLGVILISTNIFLLFICLGYNPDLLVLNLWLNLIIVKIIGKLFWLNAR